MSCRLDNSHPDWAILDFPQPVTVLRTDLGHNVREDTRQPVSNGGLTDSGMPAGSLATSEHSIHWEINMKYTQHNAAAAISLLAHTRQQHDSSPTVSEDTFTTDQMRRARIIRSLIKTRAMLQETRNRSAELHNALERFKDTKKKIANG